MGDMVVDRRNLKETLGRALGLLTQPKLAAGGRDDGVGIPVLADAALRGEQAGRDDDGDIAQAGDRG